MRAPLKAGFPRSSLAAGLGAAQHLPPSIAGPAVALRPGLAKHTDTCQVNGTPPPPPPQHLTCGCRDKDALARETPKIGSVHADSSGDAVSRRRSATSAEECAAEEPPGPACAVSSGRVGPRGSAGSFTLLPPTSAPQSLLGAVWDPRGRQGRSLMEAESPERPSPVGRGTPVGPPPGGIRDEPQGWHRQGLPAGLESRRSV